MTFLVNIGSSVEAKIPSGKKRFSDYLNNPNSNSFFLRKCVLSEITDNYWYTSNIKSLRP